MTHSGLSRRKFLARGALVGCSVAASPLLTPVSFAMAPSDNRLVVILLRGGMDGLDLLRPWHDPAFAIARPTLAQQRNPTLEVQDGYGIHPAVAPLLPLWHAGELSFVQSVSTPYRNKRSHFDGQDLLEAGTANLGKTSQRDGWLNRMLQGMQGVEAHTAYAIGADPMLLSRGSAPVSSWSPDVDFVMSAQGARLLQEVMQSDTEMALAMAQAVRLSSQDGGESIVETDASMLEASMDAQMSTQGQGARGAHKRVAEFAAEQLRGDARIACFSLGGWDTHNNQKNTMVAPLKRLAQTILTLKANLGGAAWQRTTVLAMTEFGRTVRENGSRGTDHGTGGAMVLAGGALRGGRVLGHALGLDEAALYQRRDVMPTDDVRRYAAWAIRSSFGLSASVLERDVFPGLEMKDDPGLLA